jgi:hypothetical protein
MRSKRVTEKDLLVLSISIFVVVVLWIGFNIYHAWATSTISEDLQLQIIPIEGKFDTQTLNKLKTRKKIEPIFELSGQSFQNPATPSAQISPTITISPTTQEPTPTEEPVVLIEEPIPTETEPTPEL